MITKQSIKSIYTYDYIKSHTKTVEILQAAFSLLQLLFRRKHIQALRSAGGFRRPQSLGHKEELNKTRMAESHREDHDFRCRLATRKCQEPHGPPKQPVRRMHGPNRKDRTGESLRASHTSDIYIGREDLDFFALAFENTASCMPGMYICSTTCWCESTPSACLRCCRALIGAYLLCCLLRAVTALCCTALCLRCL